MTTVIEFPDRRILVEEAAQWLIRLDADTPPTRAELRALGEWLHRSPAHREELESLAALWGRMNVLTELGVPLGNGSRSVTHAGLERRIPSRRAIGLLAASVMFAVLTWLLVVPELTRDPLLAGNGLYATAVGQQKMTTLADGSQVILNTNSQIKVDYGEGYRDVYLLQGEVMFTVAKNPEQPFRVYAGDGRVEALGTAFSVYLDGADVSVAVTEGRVSLASVSSSGREGTGRHTQGSLLPPRDARMELLGTLGAGQVATIHNPQEQGADSGSKLQRGGSVSTEALAQRLAWRDGILLFSGETLETVVKEFQRYTTVSIEITDPAVRQLRIGGRFPVGETETMLAALETNFNLRVIRLSHNRVVIAAAEE